MNSISDEVIELRALPMSDLLARYEAVFGKATRVKHREYLWKRIAWKIQEQRFGGLSETAKARLEELIAEIDIDLGAERKQVKRARNGMTLGTTVSRMWKDHEVRATSVEGGWEHEGTTYRSLSAVAKHVTGSHWNGKLFFGLTRRAE